MYIVYIHESCFEFSAYYPGFSFTFEVKRPKPLGGGGGGSWGYAPLKTFKT